MKSNQRAICSFLFGACTSHSNACHSSPHLSLPFPDRSTKLTFIQSVPRHGHVTFLYPRYYLLSHSLRIRFYFHQWLYVALCVNVKHHWSDPTCNTRSILLVSMSGNGQFATGASSSKFSSLTMIRAAVNPLQLPQMTPVVNRRPGTVPWEHCGTLPEHRLPRTSRATARGSPSKTLHPTSDQTSTFEPHHPSLAVLRTLRIDHHRGHEVIWPVNARLFSRLEFLGSQRYGVH